MRDKNHFRPFLELNNDHISPGLSLLSLLGEFSVHTRLHPINMCFNNRTFMVLNTFLHASGNRKLPGFPQRIQSNPAPHSPEIQVSFSSVFIRKDRLLSQYISKVCKNTIKSYRISLRNYMSSNFVLYSTLHFVTHKYNLMMTGIYYAKLSFWLDLFLHSCLLIINRRKCTFKNIFWC